MNASLKDIHAAHAATARKLYQDSREPAAEAANWRLVLREARRIIGQALKASDYLRDVSSALRENGAHMLALRHFTAPPISQDQFKLICGDWPKSSEKSGRGIGAAEAAAAADAIHRWRDRRLTRWIDGDRQPTRAELREVLLALAPLIASQRIATSSRNRLAAKQERLIVGFLEAAGWTRLPSSLIDRRALVAERHFMHKTRFATATATPQEVDVACGLKDAVVMAMECKVTNDETNSVKRVNDVLKKAEAWRTQWGNTVVTAAMLQGVIAPKDVERLIDAGVQVFWAHDLDGFAEWLGHHA